MIHKTLLFGSGGPPLRHDEYVEVALGPEPPENRRAEQVCADDVTTQDGLHKA